MRKTVQGPSGSPSANEDTVLTQILLLLPRLKGMLGVWFRIFCRPTSPELSIHMEFFQVPLYTSIQV